ncbi:Sugar phosphate permease [Pseudomonas reinekei]|uniref:MFS transporter n=1 Tax=Pseudomonas reinekei TaxID=395598 RepID=A0A1H0ISN5_PSERE|nr:MFS transporter [Pseudomonas reinekei]KAB0486647.1 MHS family MFS transporter [Pseudomonas reinekei]OLU04353.1 MFS transporter [Pseudomonas reinekei]SDO34362.1 Sugar phosphate permease [Pseudomonas reinekei]
MTYLPQKNKKLRRIVAASVIGNALEWYDFFLYGTAAALVFGPLFFPAGTDPVLGTLASFAGFAVGFVARPVGGIIFGHIGDRRGRKQALVITLTMMGIATFLMGLLPTFEQAGYLAPACLVILRVIQGIASGGEWGGGVLMLSENAPPDRIGFYSSWSQLGVTGGFLLSSAAFYLVQMLSTEDFMSWGWRIPFLASVVIVGVGYYIRRSLPESESFVRDVKAKAESKHLPALQVLREHPKAVLQAMGLRLAENGGVYIFLSFTIAYAKFTGLSTQLVLAGIMLAMVFEAFSILFWGWLSDIVGRRAVYAFGAVSLTVLAFPFFWLIDTHQTHLIYLALFLGLPISHGAMIGTQPALMGELFPTEVRYTGLAMGHEIASIFAGGFAPLIAMALFASQKSSWPVSVMLIVFGVLTLFALYTIKPQGKRVEVDSSLDTAGIKEV